MFTPRSRILVFVCDIQERFRPLIHKFDGLETSAATLLQATAVFQEYQHQYTEKLKQQTNAFTPNNNHSNTFPYAQIMDVYVTEQYPKALGKTSPLLQSYLYSSLSGSTVDAATSTSLSSSSYSKPSTESVKGKDSSSVSTIPVSTSSHRNHHHNHPICRNVYTEEKLQFSMISEKIHQKINQHIYNSSPSLLKAILFGMETHVCVQQTALDLRKLNIDVILPVDAISSQREVDRNTALHFLQTKGCTLTTTESLLFDYMKGANYPQFKTISKLMVKYGTAVPPNDRLDFY